MCVSRRTPGPPGGWYAVIRPGEGAKFRSGSSALMRNSMACPRSSSVFSGKERGLPAATRICSFTRSSPVVTSVTGCSTWIRVFISMK
jgi:hypothetical protein